VSTACIPFLLGVYYIIIDKGDMIMNNKNTGMIATIATALLCGCPGAFLCLFGAISSFGGGTYSLGSDGGNIPPAAGIGLVCVALIMLLIPVGVGFFTLRKKPEATVAPTNEPPVPPAAS
jgi:hypothetical protein